MVVMVRFSTFGDILQWEGDLIVQERTCVVNRVGVVLRYVRIILSAPLAPVAKS